MQRRLTWIILLLATLAVAWSLTHAINLYTQEQVRESGREWIVEVTLDAMASWEAEKLIDHLAPELLDETPASSWSRYFRSLSALGEWEAVEAVEITAESLPDWWQGSREASLDIELRIRFANDAPTIRTRLHRDEDTWRIRRFQVLTRLLAA
ncbi:MAG: hypothetical protein WEB57_06840 [Pseudohongiellaceae bacterium]